MLSSSYRIEINDNITSIKQESIILPELGSHQVLVDTNAVFHDKDDPSIKTNLPAIITGKVVKIGTSVQNISINSSTIGLTYNTNYLLFSQFYIIDESMAYVIPDDIDNIKLLPTFYDYFEATTIIHRIPIFPKPTSFLLIDPSKPLLNIMLEMLSKLNKKIMLFYSDDQLNKDLESLNVVSINTKHDTFLNNLNDETYGIGASCIIDFSNRKINIHKSPIFENIVHGLSIGGSIFTNRNNITSEECQILMNKNASIFFCNTHILMKSTEFNNFFSESYKQLINKLQTADLFNTDIKTISITQLYESHVLNDGSNNIKIIITI